MIHNLSLELVEGIPSWNLLLLLLFLLGAVKANPLEYVLISPKESTQPFQIKTTQLKINNQNAFLAIVKGALGKDSNEDAEPQKHFRILVHDSKCSLRKTSTFSRQFNCIYAVNGGPFHSYVRGGCVGLTVSNGTIIEDRDLLQAKVHHRTSTGSIPRSVHVYDDNNPIGEFQVPLFDANIAFGVTKDNKWIIGNVQKYNHSNIEELVTGLNGWLVYNSTVVPEPEIEYELEQGQNQAQSSHRKRISDLAAPRTAIGVNKSGKNLVILQVDGCEHCTAPFNTKAKGLTMHEMANAMQKYADYAINLDGGGSSTSVNHGNIWNRPTCLDYVDVRCERPVASVVCIDGHEDN